MQRLGINIDHIATIRNARGEGHPNILKAAMEVMNCLLYTSPSPRDVEESRMPSSA